MTKKLYYENAYQKDFEANVISCTKNKYYEIILDATAFYPEGGGQPADTGYLNDVLVLDTQESEQGIVHFTKEPIEEGTGVNGKIDWEKRFLYSQQHSGEHIFSGIVHEMCGYDNVGFHMGKDYVTVDFSGVLDEEQIKKAERRTNEIIIQNEDILITYPSKEELEILPYRSKKKLEGDIRIVTIPNADICACCGTHVAKTGEIGMLKVISSENFRGGTRLTLQIGWQAYEDYDRKSESVKRISNLLSAKPEKVVEAVEKMQDALTEMKLENGRLKEQIFETILAQTEAKEQAVLFVTEFNTDDIRRLCDKAMKQVTFAAVFTGNEQSGYAYVLGSHQKDVVAYGKKMNEALNGRGGGKDTMFQGRMSASREEIEAYLKENTI